MHDLYVPISTLLASVATEVIMPRFRNLAGNEVTEKSRGEVVTIADLEAEDRLKEGVLRIDRNAQVVGEEACSQDPELLKGLNNGRIWLIDPIDGTSNFAKGDTPFGIMIALIENGITEASWLYDPCTKRICHASRARGAFINEAKFRCPDMVRERPIAALATQFMPPIIREHVHAVVGSTFNLVPIPRCASEHYPRVAIGENDAALFQRTLPWDHAPGVLFLTEAGGRASRWDGSQYNVTEDGVGLIIARNEALWELMLRAVSNAMSNVF